MPKENDKLKAGIELLDYTYGLQDVCNGLQEALDKMLYINQNLTEEIYKGEALETMQLFTQNLQEHILKLQKFYQKGAKFTAYSYETYYQSDEAMAMWLVERFGNDGGDNP